jgi:hypothetical protein
VKKRAGGAVAGPDDGPWRWSYRRAPPLLEVSTVRPCSICPGARLIRPPANRAEVVARSRRGSNNPRRAGQGSRCRRLLCKDDSGFVPFRRLGGAAGLDRKERGGWIWWGGAAEMIPCKRAREGGRGEERTKQRKEK